MGGLSLRRRLQVGFAIVALLLVGAGWLAIGLQRGYLVAQVDQRLERQLTNAESLVGRPTGEAVGAQGRRAGMLADSYLGVVDGAGVLTLSAPADDPDLRPLLDVQDLPTVPTTVPASGGLAARMRVITSQSSDGRAVVLGRSLSEVDSAVLSLTTTMLGIGAVVLAVIGLVFWWIIRLGLAPIAAVTGAARQIRRGDQHARAPQFPIGTEAHELGAAFNELVDANQATNSMLRQFVADASHELRTPLTTLRGYADLRAGGGLADPGDVDDAMRRIRAEAARMTRLVEDLLLLADLDREQGADQPGRLAVSVVDLSAIVRDVGSDLAVLAPDREVATVAAQRVCVPGDSDRLTQLVTILATNALRHTPAGTPIRISLAAVAQRVRLEVADDGPGIPPAAAERVFDRFYRSDSARARPGTGGSRAGGSGLGLAIAAAITAAHGGRIGLTSPTSLGGVGGTTFWVELPRS